MEGAGVQDVDPSPLTLACAVSADFRMPASWITKPLSPGLRALALAGEGWRPSHALHVAKRGSAFQIQPLRGFPDGVD